MYLAGYLEKSLVERWMLKRYYPDGPKCPACGAVLRDGTVAARNFAALRRFICPDCRRQTTALAGTPIATTRLSAAELFALVLARECCLGLHDAAALIGHTPAGTQSLLARLDGWELLRANGDGHVPDA